MLEKIIAHLPEVMFTFVLPLIFIIVSCLKILWHKLPVSISALVWMAALVAASSFYYVVKLGEINLSRFIDITFPVTMIVSLRYLESCQRRAEKAEKKE